MWRYLIIWAVIIFAADQLSKYLVVHVMDLANRVVIDVWPGFLTFIMAWNYGINFGLFAGQGDLVRWLLTGVAVLITIGVIFWVRSQNRAIVFISAGVLIGGALGNVIDRVIYGAVADFLNVTCCGIRNPFSFNVADIAIFVGAAGLILFATDDKQSR